MPDHVQIIPSDDQPILHPQFQQFCSWPFARELPGPDDWAVIIHSHHTQLSHQKYATDYYSLMFLQIYNPDSGITSYALTNITAFSYKGGNHSSETHTIPIPSTYTLEDIAHHFLTVSTVMKDPAKFFGPNIGDMQPPIFTGKRRD